MTSLPDLDQMPPEQLRALAAQLMSKVDTMGRKIHRDETIIEQLTHEIAILKRHKFAKRSEQISPAQGSLLDDLLNTDLEAIEADLKALHPAPAQIEPRQQPKRAPLPPQFPRTVIHHEPDNTQCACGCQLQRIGEDVSEKLDYTPGVFTVEQHVRGKWACRQCETLTQAPVPPQVIDKGIPTAGLLAQVMVAKFADHLPLYRQEKIFGRAGLAIPRSTLAQWMGQTGVQLQPLVDALREAVLAQRVVHADETPVQMLAPGEKKTHRAYVWAYSSTPFSALKAVVYDFSPKALDYSLKRWVALTRYLDDGAVPIDNNQIENLIRPWALGRSNWLFAGSLRSGKRAAAIMSLIQSARMNGHDPYAYLKDVLTQLPTQRASEIERLLPHSWAPA
ncbi:IS66 family transposase [Pseudomonas orientalis]|uniref:IS66 family transposase n=1 Tax=Pseudomonas orientalis TaxID=76758 RepID=UPI0034D665BE